MAQARFLDSDIASHTPTITLWANFARQKLIDGSNVLDKCLEAFTSNSSGMQYLCQLSCLRCRNRVEQGRHLPHPFLPFTVPGIHPLIGAEWLYYRPKRP